MKLQLDGQVIFGSILKIIGAVGMVIFGLIIITKVLLDTGVIAK